MVLLPAFAPTSNSNIADRLSKPLPTITHQRLVSLLEAAPTDHPLASATLPTSVASTVTATVVAPTTTLASDSVLFHPNLALTPTPIVLDTGASYSRASSASDFLPVGHAAYGLFRPPISDVSKALASTPVDPYTRITGEDTATVDLSSPDTVDFDSDSGPSDSEPSFTKVSFDIRQFGTASLTFIYSKSSSELLHIFVDPNQIDWLHWVPLPRLTPTESYFHIFGRDYPQVFALFHLIPIWIALVSALLRSE